MTPPTCPLNFLALGEPHLMMRPSTDVVVDLGPFSVRIVSDVPNFRALAYFSTQSRRPPGSITPDVELFCMSHASPSDLARLALVRDNTARARSFAEGYYVTDHFGPPVTIVTRGSRILVAGQRLEHLVWPYFVKYLLLQYSVMTGSLFLKASAIEVKGAGVLVLGRGGAGKTVLISHLCRSTAKFVTNSHAIVRDSMLQGVDSSVRMRRGPWLDELTVPTAPALNPAEVVVDPFVAYSVARGPLRLRVICVVDYRGPDRHDVTPLGREATLRCLEQFALGLNVYRLEEDLLDLLGGNYRRFAEAYGQMLRQLEQLAQDSQAYYVTSDASRPDRREQLLELLGAEPTRSRAVPASPPSDLRPKDLK